MFSRREHSCVKTEDFAGGWVPKTFLLALPASEDYSDAEQPAECTISYAKWSKGGFKAQANGSWKVLLKKRM